MAATLKGDDDIKIEYLEPFTYTPTELEILGRLLAHGCAIWPTRTMTVAEVEELFGSSAIRDDSHMASVTKDSAP